MKQFKTDEKTMITISDKAKYMLKKRGDGKELFLLIRVKSGGCAGMTYDAELVGAPAGDLRSPSEGSAQLDFL